MIQYTLWASGSECQVPHTPWCTDFSGGVHLRELTMHLRHSLRTSASKLSTRVKFECIVHHGSVKGA